VIPKVFIPRKIVEATLGLAGRVSIYDAWQKFQFLSESQWWPKERLEEYQWQKLQKTLRHAYDHVPFYRALWEKHGVHPDDIRERTDMTAIPIVNRNDICQKNCLAQSSEFRKGLQAMHTSGSTGVPFRVMIDVLSYQYKFALWLREFAYVDWEVGKRMVSYWHRIYKGYPREETHMVMRDIIWGIMGKQVFPPFPTRLSTEPIHDQALRWYRRLKDFNPYLLESFHFFIQILTNFIIDNHLDPIPIKKIFCLGAPVGRERKKMEQAFPGVEIHDRYGPHEFEGIGTECSKHKGMHISVDSYYVEFLREDDTFASPREIAQLIVTDLDNKAMPLIRYDISDMASYYGEQCPCGRGLPLMSNLCGRRNDYIITADNKKLYFVFFQEFFDHYDAVRYFQISQKGSGDVDVSIVKEGETDENKLFSVIAQDLKREIGKNIIVKQVKSIEEAKNGKMSFVKRAD